MAEPLRAYLADQKCETLVYDLELRPNWSDLHCSAPYHKQNLILLGDGKVARPIPRPPLSVVAYVRWGDLFSQDYDTFESRKSLEGSVIETVLTSLDACDCVYRTVLLMEKGSRDNITGLEHPYDLISDGTFSDDLSTMLSADILIASTRTLGAYAHFVGNHVLTVTKTPDWSNNSGSAYRSLSTGLGNLCEIPELQEACKH